jgi:hypothetical protein
MGSVPWNPPRDRGRLRGASGRRRQSQVHRRHPRPTAARPAFARLIDWTTRWTFCGIVLRMAVRVGEAAAKLAEFGVAATGKPPARMTFTADRPSGRRRSPRELGRSPHRRRPQDARVAVAGIRTPRNLKKTAETVRATANVGFRGCHRSRGIRKYPSFAMTWRTGQIDPKPHGGINIGPFTTIARPAQKGLAFRSAPSIGVVVRRGARMTQPPLRLQPIRGLSQ